MREQMTEVANDDSGLTIMEVLMLLWKNIILILIIIGVATGVGVGIALMSKPTYTATRQAVVSCNATEKTQSTYNDYSLTKLALPTLAQFCMSSEDVYIKAQSLYDSGLTKKLNSGTLKITCGKETTFLQFSYTDKDEKEAVKKLNAIITASQEVLSETEDGTPSGAPKHFTYSVKISAVQETAHVNVNSNRMMTVLIAGLIGIILAVCVVLIKNFLDDSVKSKEELEKITGVKLFAYLEEVDAEVAKGEVI